MEELIRLITDKTGIVAAVVILIGLIGGIIKIVQPLFANTKVKLARRPLLQIFNVKIVDPPPHSEAGKASFELMNSRGGKAVMGDLLIEIIRNGECEIPKMVEAAAPVPQFNYNVILDPDEKFYDVRKKEFGKSPPHSYVKEEIETFTVELRSTKPQWYEFQFLVKWYSANANNPDEIFELRSDTLRIDFKPSVEELLH